MKRFWSKVAITGLYSCWEWEAGLNTCGYGNFFLKGTLQYAHRVAYTLIKGDIPEEETEAMHALRVHEYEIRDNARWLRDLIHAVHRRDHGIGHFESGCPVCQEELELTKEIVQEIIDEETE